MRKHFFDIAFTPAVKAEQTRHGSRAAYAAAAADAEEPGAGTLSPREVALIEKRDSFYIASVSESGWPYVQHRGGPVGFVRLLEENTIGWAELQGNRQYVSAGNTAVNDRVALIFMDYPHRRRLKILGRLHWFGADERPDLILRLMSERTEGLVEGLATVAVEAFDWNCPQHITPRFTQAEVDSIAAPLRARIAELVAQVGPQKPASL